MRFRIKKVYGYLDLLQRDKLYVWIYYKLMLFYIWICYKSIIFAV